MCFQGLFGPSFLKRLAMTSAHEIIQTAPIIYRQRISRGLAHEITQRTQIIY
jgi:hypothetical protein